MAQLSTTVKLDTLDHLAPSAACIKPVLPKRAAPKLPGSVLEEMALQEAVKVSLNDCLACSGCITTAETILVQLQSIEEVYSEVAANKVRSESGQQPRKLVISLAPQASASVAAYFHCGVAEAEQKLQWVFRQRLGASEVLGTLWAQNISLLEMSREFVAKYRQGSGPLLASACPGWICYAEKTHPELLPHLSSTKSPQAVLGTCLKGYFAAMWGLSVDQIYHLAIYSCYDKKLEASREDFQTNGHRETDCVVTAVELLDLLKREQLDWATIPLDPTDTHLLSAEVPNWGAESAFEASGGYLEFIFRYAAKELFGQQIDGPLKYTQRRNPNWQEVSLEVEGKKVLCFAIAYGFQQIQNLTRQLNGKTKARATYHFVEVMACPSGCLNGGGQIKAAQQTPEEQNKTLLARVHQLYQDHLKTVRQPCAEPSGLTIEEVYRLHVGGDIYSPAAQAHFHTQYHAVQKTLETQGDTIVVPSW
eukprot:NODE_1256_length_1582_cov_3.758763_g1186_i0.p1 GENE.NODE_1256_length_1582_cov_3.758763_g1186_i0~~NODE_1256_length_1582_cov_3.758763_g1186_i0.p1  ORF type:complete len:477 (-),score=135.31 NODE_1256_length_1582_cov_3.758763_g1186_i0:122-1552(-)